MLGLETEARTLSVQEQMRDGMLRSVVGGETSVDKIYEKLAAAGADGLFRKKLDDLARAEVCIQHPHSFQPAGLSLAECILCLDFSLAFRVIKSL